MESPPIIQFLNTSHTFPDGTRSIRNINLSIHPGEFLLVTGANGSGKSVLMKHCIGLLEPTEGEILFRGNPLKKQINAARQEIGLVFQDADSQIIGQTVERDTAFGPGNLNLAKDEIQERVRKSLQSMDLWEKRDKRPHLLSGGEKRRLSIAGVLAMNSSVLIFDEPFSNLDYPGVLSVLERILLLHKKGLTIVIISHDVSKILAHATRVLVMSEGEIMDQGTPSQLWERFPDHRVYRPPVLGPEDCTWLK